MTKTFTSYPSTEQFRSTVRYVRERAEHAKIVLPKLKFHGTVKIHGSNASIAFNGGDPKNFWCQSRNNLIAPGNDNAGFATYIHDHADVVSSLLSVIDPIRESNEETAIITVYGEWCGGNIQKNVAVSQLEKMFVIFGVRITYADEEVWWNHQTIEYVFKGHKDIMNANNIYSITQFPSFDIEIDFANPELSQNTLVEYTNQVEKECPVGKFFGVSGVGEGIVWTCENRNDLKTSDLFFKVKGEKHSESKVKSLAEVDVEKITNIKLLVDTIVTEHRFEKKLDDMREQNIEIKIENIGQFLKIMNTDIMKEELDRITVSGFDVKDVMQVVSKVSKMYFLNLVNKI